MLVENELKKLQKFDSAYFRRKSHFEEDGTENYLVFQPIYRFFKSIIGVGDERLNFNTASKHKITPELSYYGTAIRVEFSGSCLKQDKVTYNHGQIVNIYIVYEISKNYSISCYFD